MFQLIVKKTIPDYQSTQTPEVREKYGTLCSVLSIICNCVMVIFKLLFGFMTHSVAIQADGFNNLSDMGSNLATLFGFKLLILFAVYPLIVGVTIALISST